MNEAQNMTYVGVSPHYDFEPLSVAMSIPVAERKYDPTAALSPLQLSSFAAPLGNAACRQSLSSESYAAALAAFDSAFLRGMTIDYTMEKTGVPAAGLEGSPSGWHEDGRDRRRGGDWGGGDESDNRVTVEFPKSTAAKYAPVVASLKKNPPKSIARRFGRSA